MLTCRWFQGVYLTSAMLRTMCHHCCADHLPCCPGFHLLHPASCSAEVGDFNIVRVVVCSSNPSDAAVPCAATAVLSVCLPVPLLRPAVTRWVTSLSATRLWTGAASAGTPRWLWSRASARRLCRSVAGFGGTRVLWLAGGSVHQGLGAHWWLGAAARSQGAPKPCRQQLAGR